MNIPGIIQNDWAAEPGVMAACLHIWRALSAQQSHLDHYTFRDLQQLAEEPDVALVSKALLYLSNPRLKILKICLMYEFRDCYFELPDDEVTHYSKGEVMIHPEFGEPIPKSEILVCFTPSVGLQRKKAP